MNRCPGKSNSRCRQTLLLCARLIALSIPSVAQTRSRPTQTSECFFPDTHFHLTNHLQVGIALNPFLKITGNELGRVVLFGIPRQQGWAC